MASKKPAISTQLKTAQARITELEKELAAAKSNSDYHGKQRAEAESELRDVHNFLDAVPGAVPKKSETDVYGPERSAMTRLAAWLATRGTT